MQHRIRGAAAATALILSACGSEEPGGEDTTAADTSADTGLDASADLAEAGADLGDGGEAQPELFAHVYFDKQSSVALREQVDGSFYAIVRDRSPLVAPAGWTTVGSGDGCVFAVPTPPPCDDCPEGTLCQADGACHVAPELVDIGPIVLGGGEVVATAEAADDYRGRLTQTIPAGATVSVEGAGQGPWPAWRMELAMPSFPEDVEASGLELMRDAPFTIDWSPVADAGDEPLLRIAVKAGDDLVGSPTSAYVTCEVADSGRWVMPTWLRDKLREVTWGNPMSAFAWMTWFREVPGPSEPPIVLMLSRTWRFPIVGPPQP